ncbi:F-box/kelch-repeat protein At3g23880-like [Salvia miltiorrhiza]|uniref:F-box/kelch-repeat protein At3g23880-like n=1 Tax=Salvia miltiorrhiza TaxID=226208 RepID=UPI0025ABAF77|nr:F-box/kelch-repeat protein At3g23880-like [Salvia miltiorrhiza]
MNPDLFKNLPPEIITEIFLRLPAVSIPISKCVCKRWLHLLESDAFVKSHFARSAPALVVLGISNQLKVLELEGELDLDPLIKYHFPKYHRGRIQSSVNGFLVIRIHVDVDPMVHVDMLCVCNPITREVIKLDLPTDPQLSPPEIVSAFGFGASKISGRYKAVCIKNKPYDDKLDCHVYTLGTGSWRRLEGIPYNYHDGSGAFVNGNLHWIATIGEDSSWISCFDLETECFSFFKTPPYHAQGLPFIRGTSIFALSGCLWFCKEASDHRYEIEGELTIWIMKKYGVDESWSKEYVIPLVDGMRLYYPCIRYVEPIKVFENGDLLMLEMVYFYGQLFYYSNKTKTTQRIVLFGAREASDRVDCGIFTPTLVSLKTLGLGVENVISF